MASLRARLASGELIVVAGAWAEERRPPDRPGPESGWHRPLHVREPDLVRERQAVQVEAGATMIGAQTYRTHRRALVPYGETRRAREWTQAAVRLARQAVEEGSERRARGDRADPVQPLEVLVAGSLPALLGDEAPGEGRQPSGWSGPARDLSEASGILADAGVDVILVEDGAGPAAAALASRIAADTGIDVAVAAALDLGPGGDIRAPIAAWLEELGTIGAAAVLLEAPTDLRPGADVAEAYFDRFRAIVGIAPVPVGVQLHAGSVEPSAMADEASVADRTAIGTPPAEGGPAAKESSGPDAVDRWLEAGAALVGIAQGADRERVARLRQAVDRRDAALAAERDADEAAWRAWLHDALARAPGGAALWLADAPPTDLPGGFAWAHATNDEIGRLPHDRFRLVVAPAAGALDGVGRVLERGGILVARQRVPRAGFSDVDDLRIVATSDETGVRLLLARRDRG